MNTYITYYDSRNHYIVPTSQSEVTIMQSHGDQPRQDDESGQVEHTEGLLYVCEILLLCMVH